LTAFAATVAAVVTAWPRPLRADVPAAAALCTGPYADDFAALSAQAREYDRHPEAAFSYCARNTAVYECLSYGPDGAVRKQRKKVVLHGTAFAYRRQGADTLLLTNDHVASWPSVTDPQHAVTDVPSGCKKVSEALALVDDEHDSYARDDIPLSRVVTDPQLDVAVLKARADLHVMSWKIGHSAALHERDLVEVRGFPLGAFRATNLGKVISAHDHDDYGDWDHDDFVVDALLSSGNSGSPVLAISCATGEYELVGIFHAGYTAGSALNVVVGIDQVRDLMTTLKRSPRSHDDVPTTADGPARASVQAALGPRQEMFFPFGGQVALVRGAADGSLLFAIFDKDFPFSTEPAFVAEDLPPHAAGSFGDLGRVWLGSPRGLKVYDHAALDPDAAALAVRLLEALRIDAAGHVAYRAAAREPDASSRQSVDRTRRLADDLGRTAAARADLLQAAVDLAERLAPQPGERGATLASLGPAAPVKASP
jgi:serine protease Do